MPQHQSTLSSLTRHLEDDSQTLALGRHLARGLVEGMVVHLRGELGAGKTSLARGILRGLGIETRVKSPTYTLVESYKVSRLYLYHFDFYRLDDPIAWIDTGFREYFNDHDICLVEWPEKATGLPSADLDVCLEIAPAGRDVTLTAHSEVGQRCLNKLLA